MDIRWWQLKLDREGTCLGEMVYEYKGIPEGTRVVVSSVMINFLFVTPVNSYKGVTVAAEAVRYVGPYKEPVRHPNQLRIGRSINVKKVQILIDALEVIKKSRGLDSEEALQDLIGYLNKKMGQGLYREAAKQIISFVSGNVGFYDQEGLPYTSEALERVVNELLRDI